MRKDIVLFGTGRYFENYMACYGVEKKPVFAVDNDPEKIGMSKCGVEIKSPEALRGLEAASFYVVIACADDRVIARQLEKMGIYDYQYYRMVPMESGRCLDIHGREILADAGNKPYEIGYVPGAFDVFHVGHLNLLRNAKSRCNYLIAGVLTDELIVYFKKKGPVIPYAQRAAIVGAISYVDRVVPVDFDNTVKIDAWNRYHFDCHFSGNDHGGDWVKDYEQLKAVGAEMEFFEYTRATSSTQIKKRL